MRKLNKISAAIGICTMLMASLSGCGSSTASEPTATDQGSKELKKITVVLDWTPNTNHTGLYVAQEKGYFKEAGVEVELVQPPEGGAEQLVASGKAQFGISFQDTLAAAYGSKEPLPITTVATLLQHNTSGIVSRKGEGMESPKGLEGKQYATWDGPIELAMIKNVMEADGGDYGKLKRIPSTVTDEVSALKTKSVDAIWIYYGWAGVACEKANLPIDYFAFKDINPVFDYYTPVIVGNDTYLKENPEETKAFLQAVEKGYRYAIDQPEDAAEILLKAAPELDKDLVVASQKYMKDQYMAEVKEWGYIDQARWNAFYNWLNDNELVENKIPENTGFTNEYLSK
ncbi:MAG: ABC transporter substrate-binding protein [bacterium]|nr:ABC transporter substrate-binding protein [bacterium]